MYHLALLPIITLIFIWGASLWACYDVYKNNLDIKPPYISESFGPFSWFLACRFFIVIFLPIYLFERNKVLPFKWPSNRLIDTTNA